MLTRITVSSSVSCMFRSIIVVCGCATTAAATTYCVHHIFRTVGLCSIYTSVTVVHTGFIVANSRSGMLTPLLTASIRLQPATAGKSSIDNSNADQYCDPSLSPTAATSALLPGPTSPFARASLLARSSLRAGRRSLFSGGASLKPPPEPTVRAAVLSFDDLSGAVVQYCDDELQQQQRIPVHSVPKLAVELASVTRQSDAPRTPWGLVKSWLGLFSGGDSAAAAAVAAATAATAAAAAKRAEAARRMKGAPLVWLPLRLSEAQSGGELVAGTVQLKLLYHTRGTVLRGLDVAVSHMSLGEVAEVQVCKQFSAAVDHACGNVV
jgi:hypothetical protein